MKKAVIYRSLPYSETAVAYTFSVDITSLFDGLDSGAYELDSIRITSLRATAGTVNSNSIHCEIKDISRTVPSFGFTKQALNLGLTVRPAGSSSLIVRVAQNTDYDGVITVGLVLNDNYVSPQSLS